MVDGGNVSVESGGVMTWWTNRRAWRYVYPFTLQCLFVYHIPPGLT
jgi:hypothetical protein